MSVPAFVTTEPVESTAAAGPAFVTSGPVEPPVSVPAPVTQPIEALGSVDARDAELVGWHTAPTAGSVPIPRLPAPAETFSSLADAGTADRALTVLPRPRRRFGR